MLSGVLSKMWLSPQLLWTLAIVPVTVVLVRTVRFVLKMRRISAAMEQFPHVPRKSFFRGNVEKVKQTDHVWLNIHLERTAKFKYCYSNWLSMWFGAVVCCHPDTIKPLLKLPDPKSRTYHVTLHEWLGDGLLIASGKKWARSRRLLTPAFHFEILKPYFSIYNDAADIMAQKLDKMATDGDKFDVFNHISLLTLDIILQCAFSYKTDCQTMGRKHPYIQAVYDLVRLWQKRSMKLAFIIFPWLYRLTSNGREFSRLCKLVHSQAETIIHKRKTDLERDGKVILKNRKYLDFLDILLTAKDENGDGMSPSDMRAEVDTFLFEGHDTTASGISWTLYCLASNPEEQRRCQDEVDALMQEKDSSTITSDDLPRLKYLSLCLKESMRMYSPVPVVARETTQDIEIMGKTLPAGTNVSINLFATHHNPHVWGEDHNEYKPERFLPENMKDMDSFAYVPFSAGPRNCIGQNFALNEEKVILARLLHRFEFGVAEDQEVLQTMMLILRTEKELYLTVKHRQT